MAKIGIVNMVNSSLFKTGLVLISATVVPTKNDSDVIFCLHINLFTPLDLTRIDRSLVF